MLRYLVLFLCLFLILPICTSRVLAQKPTRPSDSDTTRAMPFAKPDTMETMPVHSNLYWYNIENQLFTRRDSSIFQIFRYQDEKALIYTEFSDVLWNHPLWFVYDLKERGRPAYIAFLNKYPHQTTLFYNSVPMNDPTHGMFNSQLFSIIFTHSVESDIVLGNLQNFACSSGEVLYINPNSMHTKAPWTKVLYKQGGFGHSDLDISFVLPLTETIALQLGGFNELYDGTIINAASKGYNFRGELTWQYSPSLYMRGQFYLSRNRVGLTPYNFPQEILLPQHEDHRDDFFLDLTWHPYDSTEQRLHFILYHGYALRSFKDRDNPQYIIDTKSKMYGFDTNYNIFIKQVEILFGLGMQYPQIWGDAFQKTYYPYRVNGYGKIKIPFWKRVTLQAAAQVAFLEGYKLQVIPTATIAVKPALRHEFDLALTRGIRFPNSNERFFDFDTLYGNQDLQSEKHLMVYGRYKFKAHSNWQLQSEVGYCRVENEIQWQEPSFKNSAVRDFAYSTILSAYRFWHIELSLGGHYTFSKTYITPRSSIWGGAHFYYNLFNFLKFDAYGTFYYYDKHNKINFEPRIHRFYTGSGENDPYYVLNWKLVATIKDFKIFAEMDNALGNDYEIINGYTEFYYRFRFGINWVFWD